MTLRGECCRLLLDSLELPERVEDAASAAQAAVKLGEIAPDLVFLDLDLPGTGTIDALRGADAPCLVVMTAHPELRATHACARSRATAS